MEEARRVIERLDRIDVLRREGAAPATLLREVRGLLGEAEAWARGEETGPAAKAALERMRRALENGNTESPNPKRTLVA